MSIDIPDYYPLRTIWLEHLQDQCSERQLKAWAGHDRNINFPEPKTTLGVYHLYDVDEVVQWVYLWKRATAGLGRGDELNA